MTTTSIPTPALEQEPSPYAFNENAVIENRFTPLPLRYRLLASINRRTWVALIVITVLIGVILAVMGIGNFLNSVQPYLDGQGENIANILGPWIQKLTGK